MNILFGFVNNTLLIAIEFKTHKQILRGEVDKVVLLFLEEPDIQMLEHFGLAPIVALVLRLFGGLVELLVVDLWRMSEEHVETPCVVAFVI